MKSTIILTFDCANFTVLECILTKQPKILYYGPDRDKALDIFRNATGKG